MSILGYALNYISRTCTYMHATLSVAKGEDIGESQLDLFNSEMENFHTRANFQLGYGNQGYKHRHTHTHEHMHPLYTHTHTHTHTIFMSFKLPQFFTLYGINGASIINRHNHGNDNNLLSNACICWVNGCPWIHFCSIAGR